MAEPILYDFYGNQYDYNALRRAYDTDLWAYLRQSGLDEKYYDEAIQAGNNLMNGLKTKRVNYQDGVFHDSQGEYRNAEKRKQDVYGIMANYIQYQMNQQTPYQKPSDPNAVAYNNRALGTWLSQLMFNADRPTQASYLSFIGLDPLDKNSNSRGIGQRSAEIKKQLTYMRNNLTNRFKNISDTDKTNALSLIDAALKGLEDNILNENDYYALNRITPNFRWDLMMSTAGNQQQQIQNEIADGTRNADGSEKSAEQQLEEYFAQNHPLVDSSKLSSVDLSLDYNPKMRRKQLEANINNIFKEATVQDLEDIILSTISGGIKNWKITAPFKTAANGRVPVIDDAEVISKALWELYRRNQLVRYGDTSKHLWYIPNLSTKSTGFIWDADNNKIMEVSGYDIPELRQKWLEQAQQELGYTDNNYPYLSKIPELQKKAKGGVLKYQTGNKIPWYEGAFTKSVNPNNYYTTNWDTSRLIAGDTSNGILLPWASTEAGLDASRYTPTRIQGHDVFGEGQSHSIYAKGVEDSDIYQEFGNSLLDQLGNFTDVGLAWAKEVDRLLPQNSLATFFDENGNLRTSWTVKTKDAHGRPAHQTFTNLADYVKAVRNDQLIGARHNIFGKVGDRFYYRDNQGNKIYVDPSEAKRHQIKETPDDPIVDGLTTWHDYELIGPQTEQTEQGSDVNPEQLGQKKTTNWAGILSSAIPDLMGAGRLYLSLHANNKIANTLKDAIRPVLHDTYERYSPIVGDYQTMAHFNNQAADIRRQAARPATSDASLQTAIQFDANRQANELETKGMLADNQAIEQSRREALARVEDNMARRSKVANENRDSIYEANLQDAQVEAQRRQSNWASIDNYLKDFESRLRTRQDKVENFLLSAGYEDLQNEVQDVLSPMIQDFYKWQAIPGNENKTMQEWPGYSNFIDKKTALNRWLSANRYALAGSIYGIPYKNEFDYPAEQAKLFRMRKGGRLSLSTENIIRKVISEN